MKIRKSLVVFAALLALLLFVGVYLWGPSKAPPGQKSLLTLTAANFSEFEVAFDEATDGKRLVLLLSPT